MRLNLDTFSTSRRREQLEAAWEAATQAEYLSKAENGQNAQQKVEYTLLSNPLRALIQADQRRANVHIENVINSLPGSQKRLFLTGISVIILPTKSNLKREIFTKMLID